MARQPIRLRPRQADVESLESRRMLAAFGTPWPNARDLSISFPAGTAAIGDAPNDLDASLVGIATTQQWQELALRAYQTWAVHADINIGLRADHGLDFGAPGLLTRDPRFGEFRVGGFAQSGVLGNTLPFQTVAGTWSGDLLLNSSGNFNYHDWAQGLPPDPASIPEGTHDLFSVLLHEAGNSLGLADTMTSSMVMFGNYSGPKGLLTEQDIAELQALYGARTDPYELVSNNELSSATLVPAPVGLDASSETIQVRGSVLGFADVDVYSHTLLPNETSVTLSVRASGLSLLKPKFEVMDATGTVIAAGTTTSVFDNDIVLNLTGLEPGSTLFLKVSAAQDDIYATGDYELVLDYRDEQTRLADPVPADYDEGIESLNTHFALADDELGLNDTILTAMALASADGYGADNRFEAVSSVSARNDVDFFSVTAPSDASSRLVVHVAGVGLDAPDLKVRVVDSTGQDVGARGRLRADGTWVVEVLQPQASAEYLIRVSVNSTSVVDVGNYVIAAEFATESAQMNQFVSGTVESGMDDFVRWTSQKTRLYRFDLSAFGSSPDHLVQLTIYDAQTREIRMVLTTPSGGSRHAFALLCEGEYTLRFQAISRDGSAVEAISYNLIADGISDDQDPYGGGAGDLYYYGYGYDYYGGHDYYNDGEYAYYYEINPDYAYNGDPYGGGEAGGDGTGGDGTGGGG